MKSIKSIKTIPALALALLLTILLLAPASAEGAAFDMSHVGRGVLSRYHGGDGEVTVPGALDGVPARVLSVSAFNGAAGVTGVTFESGVTIVEEYALFDMAALERVELPDTLAALGMHNLASCPSLREITIPAAVRFVGRYCLTENDALQRVTFTGEAPFFDEGCFESVSPDLTVYVPDDRLDEYAAALPEGLNLKPSGSPCEIVNRETPEEDFTIDGEGVITAYNGQDPVIEIPAQIGGVAVKGLGESLFEKNIYLYGVTLPEGLESIGPRAFNYATNIASLSLPDSVKDIGARAFEYCDLVITHWPASLETIGEDAFHSCRLSEAVDLPEGLKTIERGAFRSAYVLTDVTFPESLETIGDEAFAASTSLEYLIFSSSVLPEIAPHAFEGSEIIDVDLPMYASRAQAADAKAVFEALGQAEAYVWRAQDPDIPYAASADSTYEDGFLTSYIGSQEAIKPYDLYEDRDTVGIGEGALKGNSVVRVFGVPHSDVFTTVGAEAFMNSVLERIDLFDSVTDIGARAFANCHGLTALTLPESLERIDATALEGCDGLTAIEILCDIDLLPDGLLKDCPVSEISIAGDMTADEIDALLYRLGAIDSLLDEEMQPFAGEWYGVWIDVGLMKGDPRTMWNMTITLTLNDDCTGTLDFIEPDEGKTWFMSDGAVRYGDEAASAVLSMIDGGLMAYTQDDGGQILFSRDPDEVYYKAVEINERLNAAATEEPTEEPTEAPTEEPTGEPASVPTAEPVVTAAPDVEPAATDSPTAAPAPANPQMPATPVPTTPAVLKTDTRYACVSVTAAGVDFTPEEIGGDCAVVFYDDGSCDLVLAGKMDESGPRWTVDGWNGTMVVTTGGEELVFVPTEDGCEMNYRGIMVLHYVEEGE